MTSNPTPVPQFPNAEPVRPRRGFWQKLGGGSLSISLILHVIILAIGVVWIFQIIPAPKDKDVDFGARSGGGESLGEKTRSEKHMNVIQPKMPRVVSFGSEGITLPDPENASPMTAIGSSRLGGKNGLGGTGSDGGWGPGHGPLSGTGNIPATFNGNGSKTPFGIADGNLNALVGTFYDLKQTSAGEPTNMTDDEMREALPEIVRRGFKEKVFEKYFKAPRKLYQTKLQIPITPADAAPAAFECEKEVHPKRWLVAYRGSVQAPHAGRYRFVGLCDDLLVVRFNNRPVFDYGYTIAGTGTHVYGRSAELDGTNKNPGLAKEIRRQTPMSVPFTFYKYASTPRHNELVGGFAVGPEFEARTNTTYPIEILIGEIPGGYFSVSLMIEEIGVNYNKDPNGAPILPLFRLDDSQPDPNANGELPPIDPHGPTWQFVPSSVPDDI